MAKIEMDLSEYERMIEVKNLLEKSLEKERKLTEEIDRLTQEKLKALKDAEKRVVKITRKEITEHPVQLRENSIITRSVLSLLGVPQFAMMNINMRVIDYRELSEMFFEKSKVFNHPVEESITTHGLDEIKSEIEKDLRKEFETDISKSDLLRKENQDLNQKLGKARIQEKYQAEINDIANKDNERYRKSINDLELKLEDHLKNAKSILELTHNYDIWNSKTMVRKIRNILN